MDIEGPSGNGGATSEGGASGPESASNAVLSVAAVGPMVVALAMSICPGVETTADSADYLAAATSLLDGGTLRTVDGHPLVAWPPLYSILLVPPLAAGIPVASYVQMLNLLLVVCLVLAVARGPSTRWAAVVAGLLAATSPLTMWVAVAWWSELPFLVLSAFFLVALSRLFDEPRRAHVAPVALLAAGLSMLRYVGVVAGALGTASVLVAFRHASRRARIEAGLLFAAIAFGPLVAWLMRNLAVAGSPTGIRAEAEGSLWSDAARLGEVLASTVLPRRVVVALPSAVLLAGAGVVILAPLVLLARRGRGLDRGNRLSILASAYTAAYAIAILAASRRALDPIDLRLLAPLAVPLAFIGSGFARGGVSAKSRGRRSWGVLRALCISGCVAVQTVHSAGILTGHHARQRSTTARLEQSPTLAYVKTIGPDVPLFSNEPGLVYLARGGTVGWIPRLRYYRSAQPALDADLASLRASHASGTRALFVWLRTERTPFVADPADLQRHLDLRLVTDLSDGIVYEARIGPP